MTGQILPPTVKIAHIAIGLRTALLLAKMARKCALAQVLGSQPRNSFETQLRSTCFYPCVLTVIVEFSCQMKGQLDSRQRSTDATGHKGMHGSVTRMLPK